MNSKQQASAKSLYFQTDLSKTQIAEILRIPRRTLHYWIREKNWDRIKKASEHMPALIADKCYHIMSRFSDQLLGEDRIMRPVTHKEADTLHKLTLTINKLKTRATLNESLETFGFFMESVHKKSPEMAQAIMPFVDNYIASRAAVNVQQFRPDTLNDMGLMPHIKEDVKEEQLDMQDIMEWTEADNVSVDLHDIIRANEPEMAGKTDAEISGENKSENKTSEKQNVENAQEHYQSDAELLNELEEQLNELKGLFPNKETIPQFTHDVEIAA